MKTFSLPVVLIILLLGSFMPNQSFAQKKHGHPHRNSANVKHAEPTYIYYPQHNFYYERESRVYFYPDGHSWHRAQVLPSLYAGINLGTAIQVVLDYRGERPYLDNHYHCEKHQYKAQHKAWKKHNKEWEKREKEWAKGVEKRHSKCKGDECREYSYEEGIHQDRPNGRVRVDVSF